MKFKEYVYKSLWSDGMGSLDNECDESRKSLLDKARSNT